MKLALALMILAGIAYLVFKYRAQLKEWMPGFKAYLFNLGGMLSTVMLAVTDWFGKMDLTQYMTKENAFIAALAAFTLGTLISVVTKRANDDD